MANYRPELRLDTAELFTFIASAAGPSIVSGSSISTGPLVSPSATLPSARARR